MKQVTRCPGRGHNTQTGTEKPPYVLHRDLIAAISVHLAEVEGCHC